TARAQSPADVTGYKQHMENGVKLYQDKNYEAAIVEFEAAYALKKKPGPLLNIALCYKGLLNYPKAIRVLETALAQHADMMDASDQKAARDAITEMKGLLGFVSVEVYPSHTTLLVDGEALPAGATSSPIALGPGTHKIVARAEGYASGEEQVTIVSGEKAKPI